MYVTCSQCDSNYDVPSHLVGGEGRALRCAECGCSWWQEGEGTTMVGKASSRTLVVSTNGRYREENHRFTSFFDGISSRFSTHADEPATHSSQRFQRLKHSREQRRHREANAIVEAEFTEIRDYRRFRHGLRIWLPRMAVIALFIAVVLILIFAA